MNRSLRTILLLALVALGLAWPGVARAVPIGGNHSGEGIPEGVPPEVADVGVTEHLNETLPLDARFRDHTGKDVALGDFFTGKRPVVFFFAYYSCPVVCSLILDDAMKSLNDVSWTLGRDYDMVVISINPHETQERAAGKRQALLNSYVRDVGGNGGAASGLHVLIGDKANIERVTKAAGFRYQYDADQDQFAHPALMMITKPDGQLARYLYGLEFPPNDVKLGLFEASEGRSINTIEQIILYCYHYDPKGGKYVLIASRVMKVGAGLTAVALGSMLALFWARERRKGGLIARAEPRMSGYADSSRPGGRDERASDTPEPNHPETDLPVAIGVAAAAAGAVTAAATADGDPLPMGTGR